MTKFAEVTKIENKITVSGGAEDHLWEICGMKLDESRNLVLEGTLDEVVGEIREAYPGLRLIDQEEDFAMLW